MMGNGSPWDMLDDEPTNRTPRSIDTRATDTRKRSWVRPSVLPDIPARDGWVHKWVRTDIYASPDKATYAKRLREGWEPIDISEYPELALHVDGVTHGRLEVGGLIACRMPAEMASERRDWYDGRTREQETSAEEHYMRDSHELIQKVNDSTRKVMFGQRAR